jgi:hypothetical protein
LNCVFTQPQAKAALNGIDQILISMSASTSLAT